MRSASEWLRISVLPLDTGDGGLDGKRGQGGAGGSLDACHPLFSALSSGLQFAWSRGGGLGKGRRVLLVSISTADSWFCTTPL